MDLPTTAPGKTRQAAPLERRHTMNEHMGRPPQRPFTQYSYTPYSVAKTIPEGAQLSDRQFMSDMSLNRMPQGNVPDGRLGHGTSRHSQNIEEAGAWAEVPVRGEQRKQGRRASLMEAQLNGRMGWQERGWVEARGSVHQSGRQIAQQPTQYLAQSRSTGNIHSTTVPPPLPPPNPPSQSSMKLEGAPPNYLPQHRPPSGAGIHHPNRPPVQSPVHPAQGGSPIDTTDPQPYATVGFKVKSRAQPKTAPPTEYDVLTPRHPSGAAKHQAYQPQQQNMPLRPQGMPQQPLATVPSETRVSPMQADAQRYAQGVSRQEGPRHYPATAQAFQQRSHPHVQPQTMAIHPHVHPQTVASHPHVHPQTMASHPHVHPQTMASYPHVHPQTVAIHPHVHPQTMASHPHVHPQTVASYPHVHPQSMATQQHPRHTTTRAPYPYPASQQPTSQRYQGYTTTIAGYTSADLSFPGHKSSKDPYTGHSMPYPGHMTTGLLSYPGQATTNVSYSSHMTTNMSYTSHMTSNVQKHQAPVAPPSPSHPNTQVSPAQSAPHSTGQFFQSMPFSTQSPVHHPGHPRSYPNRPQGPTADFPVGPQEHYDVLTPRGTLDTGPKATPDGSPSSGRGSTSGELLQYTEQMSRALEQFDSLLAPQSKKQIMQTSL